jgi:prepilin-type N-terminal cleavage/methylation domain-containing protein
MYKNRSRGFTLIELLVVIAIIGVLSAVVLASLNTARSKGNDASVQANLSTIQTQAEIYYGGSNSYGEAGTSCSTASSLFADTTIARAITAADSANGSGVAVCANSATAYAISVALSSTPARNWCVDSTGASSNSTTALGTSTVCPAAN